MTNLRRQLNTPQKRMPVAEWPQSDWHVAHLLGGFLKLLTDVMRAKSTAVVTNPRSLGPGCIGKGAEHKSRSKI